MFCGPSVATNCIQLGLFVYRRLSTMILGKMHRLNNARNSLENSPINDTTTGNAGH